MDARHQTPKEAMGGHEPPAPRHVIPPGEIAYEKTDIDARSVTRIAIVLAVVAIASAGVAFGVFRLLGERAERNDPPPPPLSRPAHSGPGAPEPRLQTAPVADLAAIQDEERRLLTGYGWADEAGGMGRIPIEEAMALYVGQAARPSPAPQPAASPSASAAGTGTSPTSSPSPAEGHR